jgi:hypothetical protein
MVERDALLHCMQPTRDKMDKYRTGNRSRLIRAREFGLDDGLIEAVQACQSAHFTLCKYRDLEPYHEVSIATMALDPSESR